MKHEEIRTFNRLIYKDLKYKNRITLCVDSNAIVILNESCGATGNIICIVIWVLNDGNAVGGVSRLPLETGVARIYKIVGNEVTKF